MNIADFLEFSKLYRRLLVNPKEKQGRVRFSFYNRLTHLVTVLSFSLIFSGKFSFYPGGF